MGTFLFLYYSPNMIITLIITNALELSLKYFDIFLQFFILFYPVRRYYDFFHTNFFIRVFADLQT